MNLALFDLDNTLIPIDSDHTWAEYLGQIGVIDWAGHREQNDRFYHQYHAGTLVIEEFLAFALAPLAANSKAQLDTWHAQYMAEHIRPQVLPAARALVDKHRHAGDLCAMVTATNEFVTRPIATEFGFEHLLAIELEQQDGQYTGRHVGVPSFREGKITRTHQWLGQLGHRLEDFDQSWFYSDSMNDLPLLEQVTHPVATNPDEALARVAQERDWPVIHLFDGDRQ